MAPPISVQLRHALARRLALRPRVERFSEPYPGIHTPTHSPTHQRKARAIHPSHSSLKMNTRDALDVRCLVRGWLCQMWRRAWLCYPPWPPFPKLRILSAQNVLCLFLRESKAGLQEEWNSSSVLKLRPSHPPPHLLSSKLCASISPHTLIFPRK